MFHVKQPLKHMTTMLLSDFYLLLLLKNFSVCTVCFNYLAFKPHIYIIFNHLVLLETELNAKSCVLRSVNKPFNKENASQFVGKVDFDA